MKSIKNFNGFLNESFSSLEDKYKNLIRNMGIFKDMSMAYKKNSIMENKKNTHKEKYKKLKYFLHFSSNV